MTDYIKREDAIEAVRSRLYQSAMNNDGEARETFADIAENRIEVWINEIPSADADGEDLIIKGAKGIQDGLYNIKDGKLFKYKAKGGTVRTYPIVPSADAVHKPDYSYEADMVRRLKESLSADAVQGEWKIDEYGIYHCPFCHAINNTVYKSFCPNCGARMKGGDSE